MDNGDSGRSKIIVRMPSVEWFQVGPTTKVAYLNGLEVGRVWCEPYSKDYIFEAIDCTNDRRFKNISIATLAAEDEIIEWFNGIQCSEAVEE